MTKLPTSRKYSNLVVLRTQSVLSWAQLSWFVPLNNNDIGVGCASCTTGTI
jgi:hypothetical protein